MWQTKIFNVNSTGCYTSIRYLETKDNKHWIVLRDIMKALGYASSSINSGIYSLAKTIPEQYRYTEYSRYCSPTNRIIPVIVLDYSGCVIFLSSTKKGKPSILKAWLENSIFTSEEISTPVEIPESPDPKEHTESNRSRATAVWNFEGYQIRMLMIENQMYFYAVDIAKIFGQVNHRSITIKYLEKEQYSTVYQGQRPTTVLTIEGVLAMLQHITDEKRVFDLREWLLNTAIPAYQKGEPVPDFCPPIEEKEQATDSRNENSTPVLISFEPVVPVVKKMVYQPSSSEEATEITIIMIEETAYFTVKSLATALHYKTDELLELIPSIWCSYQTHTDTVSYTRSDGQTGQQTTKYIDRCVTDSGVRCLLEKIDQPQFKEWLLASVLPQLQADGYVPADPYDIDTTGLTEKEMKDNNSIRNEYQDIKTVDIKTKTFECTFNDTIIPIIVNQSCIWFSLSAVEKALEYPLYIAQSQPLKAVNFVVVDTGYVKKLNLKEDKKGSGWMPYCIEYEGLKAFLADCKKPNAEAFYLFLEEGIIPYIKEQLNLKEAEPEMAEVKEEKKTETSVAEKPADLNINIEKLLSDPDTFIRMLKAYKAVKDSKDDLSAENEALREYIRANKSKVDFADILACDVNSEEAKQFAKLLAESIIENGSQRLKAWLVDSIQPKKS